MNTCTSKFASPILKILCNYNRNNLQSLIASSHLYDSRFYSHGVIKRISIQCSSSRQSISKLHTRFYNRDPQLNKNEDLSEEELKVLAELEEEEARVKADKSSNLRQSVSQEYLPFEDSHRIIQDVIEEVWNPLPKFESQVYEPPEEFLTRGKTGVFDLGELIDLIREENGTEVVTISIPKELDYADQMVIVTAKSPKHLVALVTYVRKRFKMKRLKSTDLIPQIVSENAKGWIALDLGNIILHVFLQTQRDFYDLEMLWTVGPVFDDLYNTKDTEIIHLLNMMN